MKRIRKDKNKFLKNIDCLIHQSDINFSHNESLHFILEEFQKEIIKSLDNNNLYDIFIQYEEYVECLINIFDHVDIVELDFRKNVSLFVSNILVSKIYYK